MLSILFKGCTCGALSVSECQACVSNWDMDGQAVKSPPWAFTWTWTTTASCLRQRVCCYTHTLLDLQRHYFSLVTCWCFLYGCQSGNLLSYTTTRTGLTIHHSPPIALTGPLCLQLLAMIPICLEPGSAPETVLARLAGILAVSKMVPIASQALSHLGLD
jgi:hypothetical protein